MATERGEDRYARFRRALTSVSLPAALVDLDAFDENVDRLVPIARRAKKTLRIASKSIRSVALLKRIMERGGDAVRGVMTYSAAETAYLHAQGFDDLLLAYPTVQRSDVDHLVRVAKAGGLVSVIVDAVEQLDALEPFARQAEVVLRVVVDLDVSYRPVGERLHLGVRRSPLRSPEDVVAFVDRIVRYRHLRFHGLMAYEAQIAGLGDRLPSAIASAPRRALRLASRRDVSSVRAAVVEALTARGQAPTIVNGGGTGSLGWASEEPALTELTAGSGFLDSHLFDLYRDLALVPAAYFALQVTRKPAPSLVTCHGGGYVASGPAGEDRLPIPVLPEGASLLSMEGAGEVQTPVKMPKGIDLSIGDPIFFRHAKAGELAEHFERYHLVRGEKLEGEARTYRGEGRCFLG